MTISTLKMAVKEVWKLVNMHQPDFEVVKKK